MRKVRVDGTVKRYDSFSTHFISKIPTRTVLPVDYGQ